LLLAVAFLDELVFGCLEAAWPFVRRELELGYAQIGVALAVPGLVALLVEPPLGLLADRGHRRRIVLAGGLAFAGSLLILAAASSFPTLVLALALLYPASGAFVSLSQTAVVDAAPSGGERAMARWTAAGSAGVLLGPLLIAVGLPWRISFAVVAVGAVPLVVLLHSVGELDSGARPAGGSQLLSALCNAEVARWLVLLEAADIAGDLLVGFLALYFVDVAGAGDAVAAVAVAVWAAADLAGNLLLVRQLERRRGLSVLRTTAAAVLGLVPAFLLVPGVPAKLALLALLAAARSCWYPLLQARLYAAVPERSGAVAALSSLGGALGLGLPVAFGLAAAQLGLGTALWGVLVAPLALLAGTARTPG
jgi:FSR family fosmidomycin resistance protein-like MFS transporter